MESGHVVVKLSNAGETHRMKVDLNHFTFEALCAKVPEIFGDATPHAWTLVYTDNEGDLVTVTNPEEYMEACRVFLRLNGDSKSMRFQVVSKVSMKDQIPPAVLQAVDDLASTLSRLAMSTKENIAQSGYLEKGRASVVSSAKQTKEFLESARKEIVQRWKDVYSRVVAEIERRRSSAASEEEMVVLSERTEASNAATSMESSGIESEVTGAPLVRRILEDSDEEDKDDGENDDDSVPPPLIPVADLTEQPRELQRQEEEEEEEDEVETPYESDAETVGSSSSDEEDESDRDWDIVPDVWNAEVSMIRGILPHVHVEDCVALLRKHSGNLEAVLIELTDL
jgi:hypothetical protein